MKDRLQNFALSLCLLLFLLSGCSQISNTEPVPGSHSDMPAPAIYSESVAGPSQEVWSEQPTAQPDPIDPIATPAADSKADGTAMPKVPIGSDDYTSKAKGDGIPAYAGSAYASSTATSLISNSMSCRQPSLSPIVDWTHWGAVEQPLRTCRPSLCPRRNGAASARSSPAGGILCDTTV